MWLKNEVATTNMKKPILFFLLLIFSVQSFAFEGSYEKYVGIYSWQGAARFRVYIQDSTNQLMISISEEGVFSLVESGADRFKINFPDIGESKNHYISFATKNGIASSMTWNLPSGKQFSGKRIKKLDKYAIDVDSQLNQKLETDDFEIWYALIDSVEARGIFNSFKENYDSLSNKFKLSDLEKLKVKIYPNKLHYAIGINLPDRMSSLLTATEYGPNMIMMGSPRALLNTPYYEMTISKGILHEFVHVLHRNYSDNAFNTGWLYEGLAIYATKCCHNFEPHEIRYFKKKKRLSFKKINSDMMMKKKYEAGPFIVEFIDNVYGWDTLIALMKEDADFQTVLGKSQDEIEKEFYDHLERKYF